MGNAVAPANQDMDYEPHQAIPKAGACSLVTRRAAVPGPTVLHGPCPTREVDRILATPGRGSQSLRTHLDALSSTDTGAGGLKQKDWPDKIGVVQDRISKAHGSNHAN